MAAIHSQIEADNKNKAIHETFGHLFPNKKHYEGIVRIAYTVYGNIEVLDENDTLPNSSPWWFASLNDFAGEEINSMECGEVAEFNISVTIVDHVEEMEQWQIDEEYEPKEWQTIDIACLSKNVLIKAF